MKIGILQTGHAPDELQATLGDYDAIFGQLLETQGLSYQAFSVVDMVFPDSVTACDGWILTGSKYGTYEDQPFIAPLEDFIRKAYAADVPMVGVCFGDQIIAQALGGKVEKFAGGWSVGRTEYTIDGETLALNAWHQDQVTQLPEGAKVVGASDFCANAALLYDDHIWTIQPHPEFTQDFIDGLIRTRGKGVVPDHQLQAASALLDAPTDNAKIADHIADFLKKERL